MDTPTIAATTARVRDWLASAPPTDALLANLPALELALAEAVNNQTPELFDLVRVNTRRIHSGLDLAALASLKLAALLRLEMELVELDAGPEYGDAAKRLIQQVQARFDEATECWHSDADGESQIVLTDVNAAFAEAFFIAWRLFGDETLRPLAVTGLVAVSEAFSSDVGLCQRRNLADATRDEPNNLGTYAAAAQMFLTASETTGRGTYTGRAQIVAEFALEQFERKFGQAEPAQRVAFAEALIRLAKFCAQANYSDKAAALLGTAYDEPQGLGAAAHGMALEHLRRFPLTVIIVGDTDADESAKDLWLASLRRYASARAIRLLHPQRHPAQIEALGYASDDAGARAYVWLNALALPPVHSAAELQSALNTAAAR